MECICHWWYAWTTHTQIAKLEVLIVSDVLGSVFNFGDVFWSVFDFGGMFESASDVNKPILCNLVMLIKCNLFSDILGSI